VFLTNLDVDSDNVVSFLKAGRARWKIEDLFNTQKHRGFSLHHKFSRVSFNGIRNWHNLRQLAFMISELVEHSIGFSHFKRENSKMTMKELWDNLILVVRAFEEVVEETIAEFEQWCKSRRQIRLE